MQKRRTGAENRGDNDVVVASTGVIGQPPPLGPIKDAMPALAGVASTGGSGDAAEAIMTTDGASRSPCASFDRR